MTLPEALARVERLRIGWTITREDKADITRVLAEVQRLGQALADAAHEINCAGPVAHRIRVMRAEHQAEVQRLREALEDARATVSEISRLRLATDEGSLRVRADRMWEVARLDIARLTAVLETP